MKVAVLKSFEKDTGKITDAKLAQKLNALIEELEKCETISSIQHLKKMTAKGKYYRIRIGDCRLGLKIEDNEINLIRFMHRKDIYKYFP